MSQIFWIYTKRKTKIYFYLWEYGLIISHWSQGYSYFLDCALAWYLQIFDKESRNDILWDFLSLPYYDFNFDEETVFYG
ncbi:MULTISPECIES: hypothetical protein [Crocosphaera]|uniref:Uncharacterized protein n=2 Tax=Crocosphaera watsonii TaxID=263511 RepID=T2ITX4_CROWT|nr:MULTISPECIES: hypothetical protein [Crocosphaera]NQZ64430.1 hypothetical protein [Crocosphaera sp.]CCQ55600.1 hypothetical protein CWATWH0005_2376 [Crocosphaera watsonii WH 0005]CCQ61372.1 hypothetical protein CWATWH0401_2079 [Crocosphaera watsonii WH 0401]